MKTEYGEQLTDGQRHAHGQSAHGQSARDQQQQSTPGAMMAEHEKMALWVQPVLMLVGGWLLISPLTLGYRDVALVWSDVASGLAIIVLASLALTPVGGRPTRPAWLAHGSCSRLWSSGRRRPPPTPTIP